MEKTSMETPGPFELDEEEPSNPRLRLNANLARKTGGGGTVHSQFRCPEYILRRIDEILAARLDPALKTRSDIFIDAVYLWLTEWDKRNPDGAGGILRAQFALYVMDIERHVRSDFLDEAKRVITELRQDGDVARLNHMLHHLQMVYSDNMTSSPQSYIDEIQLLIGQVKRLIEAAE